MAKTRKWRQLQRLSAVILFGSLASMASAQEAPQGGEALIGAPEQEQRLVGTDEIGS